MKVQIAAVALALAAVPFAAQAEEAGWCRAGDLHVSVSEGRAPVASDRLFRITFEAAGGDICRIGGVLSDVRFLHDGTQVDVPIAGGQTGRPETITVDAGHPAVVHMKAPKHAPAVDVSSIEFTLPGQGTRGDTLGADWPSAIGGPVQFGQISSPVS